MKLSAKLPPLSDSQRRYAYEHCFDSNCAIRRGRVVHCLECGGTFDIDAPKGKVGEKIGEYVCPHCGNKVDVVQSNSRYCRNTFISSFQVITSINGVAVVRTWYVWKETYIDTPAAYSMEEAHQIFMSPKWGEVIVGRIKKPMSWYVDAWDFTQPMRVRRKQPYTYHDAYHIDANCVYPIRKVPKIVKRNGWCRDLYDYKPSETIRRLLSNNHYETLAKVGRFDVWEKLSEGQIEDCWPEIRLMIRHNYFPSDISMWYDTIQMARKNDYDTRSPKYVLPANLKKMHDFMERKDKERRRKEELERMKEKDSDYKKAYGLLLSVCIKEGDITIRPLQDSAEFTEEGEKMHHCVACYFERRDSYILSARSNNKRVATIELDRKTFKVKQCRAVCNEKPERYNELLRILAAHRKELRKIGRKQDRQTKELTA